MVAATEPWGWLFSLPAGRQVAAPQAGASGKGPGPRNWTLRFESAPAVTQVTPLPTPSCLKPFWPVNHLL